MGLCRVHRDTFLWKKTAHADNNLQVILEMEDFEATKKVLVLTNAQLRH